MAMTPCTVLDHMIFQLTPTRTRFDLYIVAGPASEKLTSGLLHPFLCHLRSAEEEFARGGYSIKLEPPPHPQQQYNCISKSFWFTKDIVQRFVRFVDSPEMIERVNTIEAELAQLEKTQLQAFSTPTTTGRQQVHSSNSRSHSVDYSPSTIRGHGDCRGSCSFSSPSAAEKTVGIRTTAGQDETASASVAASTPGNKSKEQLVRALDARRSVLQKEQGMAFARAAAAGLELLHLLQLIMFGECFQATRLKEACIMYVTLSQKRQIAGFASEDLLLLDKDLVKAAASAGCGVLIANATIIATGSPSRAPHRGDGDDGEGDGDGDGDGWTRRRHENNGISSSNGSPPLCGGTGEGSNYHVDYGHKLQQEQVQQQQSSSQQQVCHWSTAREWPNVYTVNDSYSYYSKAYQQHQHGFSPGSQESFNILSDMSPPAAFFHRFLPPHSSPSPDRSHLHHHRQMYNNSPAAAAAEEEEEEEGNGKQSRFTRLHARCNNGDGNYKAAAAGGVEEEEEEEEESMAHDYEKESSEVTDSSLDESYEAAAQSSSSRQKKNLVNSYNGGGCSREYAAAGCESMDHGNGGERRWTYGASTTTSRAAMDKSVEHMMRMQPSGRSSTRRRWSHCGNGDAAMAEVELRRGEEEAGMSSSCSMTTSTAMDSSLLHSYASSSLVSSKKRLEFEQQREDGASLRIVMSGSKQDERKVGMAMKESVDMDMEVRHHRHGHSGSAARTNGDVESDMRGGHGSIYDMMSKKAAMVNSTEPDMDLLLDRRHCQQQRSGEAMKIDAELLLKSCEESSKKQEQPAVAPTAQERVKKFVDEYNEKREAKLLSTKKKRQQQQQTGIKTSSPLLPPPPLSTQAQLRAHTIRAYKAALQRSKKQQEEEERKRLEALKAQRQERIAARSQANLNTAAMANAAAAARPHLQSSSMKMSTESRTFLRSSTSFPLHRVAKSEKQKELVPSPSPPQLPNDNLRELKKSSTITIALSSSKKKHIFNTPPADVASAASLVMDRLQGRRRGKEEFEERTGSSSSCTSKPSSASSSQQQQQTFRLGTQIITDNDNNGPASHGSKRNSCGTLHEKPAESIISYGSLKNRSTLSGSLYAKLDVASSSSSTEGLLRNLSLTPAATGRSRRITENRGLAHDDDEEEEAIAASAVDLREGEVIHDTRPMSEKMEDSCDAVGKERMNGMLRPSTESSSTAAAEPNLGRDTIFFLSTGNSNHLCSDGTNSTAAKRTVAPPIATEDSSNNNQIRGDATSQHSPESDGLPSYDDEPVCNELKKKRSADEDCNVMESDVERSRTDVEDEEQQHANASSPTAAANPSSSSSTGGGGGGEALFVPTFSFSNAVIIVSATATAAAAEEEEEDHKTTATTTDIAAADSADDNALEAPQNPKKNSITDSTVFVHTSSSCTQNTPAATTTGGGGGSHRTRTKSLFISNVSAAAPPPPPSPIRPPSADSCISHRKHSSISEGSSSMFSSAQTSIRDRTKGLKRLLGLGRRRGEPLSNGGSSEAGKMADHKNQINKQASNNSEKKKVSSCSANQKGGWMKQQHSSAKKPQDGTSGSEKKTTKASSSDSSAAKGGFSLLFGAFRSKRT